MAMTADELERMKNRCYPLSDNRISEAEVFVHQLIGETHLLRATIEQQAAWLREITTERDALKLRVAELEPALDKQMRSTDTERIEAIRFKARVAELEQKLRFKQVDLHCVISANEQFQARVAELEEVPLKKCPNCDYPSWTCRRCGHWE